MFSLFLKGIGIGVANIMPGVSGGTLAVVFNIYDRLVEAVGEFSSASKEKKIQFLKFLIPVFTGVVVGILLFAKILEYLYISYPKATGFGFLLLILPSIPMIIKGEKWSKQNISAFILGIIFTLIFIVLGLLYGKEEGTDGVFKSFTALYGLKLFISGAIAAGAMIIPGISGSLLLVMLGEYYNILFVINSAVEKIFNLLKNFSFSQMAALLISGEFLIIYTFLIGIVIGIVSFSKIIDYFLKTKRGVTLFFIVGVVAASVIQILLNIFPEFHNLIKSLFL